MKLYDELKARGLIAQVTNEEEISKMINEGKATFYIGFDCTADSLTAGHFMALTLMKRLQMAGNRPIALIGGGTTMIGDPSGRTDMRKMLTKEDIDSIVFSEEGQYGGNQGSPEIQTRERKEELYDIIRRNRAGENLPDDLEPYLKKINNEGCGYVALTNSIFRYFENRSEEFQKAFGYSMYDKNGNLNFDMLLVDLYSSKDNIDPVTNIRNNMLDYNKEQDSYLNPYDPWKDVTGKGTTPAERKYYMETFLTEHGIKGTIDVQEEMSISQIEERLQRGEDVIISYRNGNIYREDGSIQQQIIGGHAMTITGVTKEGYYIVSSWGEKFYIHPDERIEFEEGQVTSMRYSVVSYS